MDSARKMAEEALAEIAAGDHGEYCGLRNGMLLAGGKTECYSDCPKRVAKEALEALLASEPAPPAGAEVREAAERLWYRLTPPANVTENGCVFVPTEDLETVLRALRANASHAPGDEGVREAAYISAALMAAAREIGYIHMLAADPLISTKEGTAVIALAEKLLGPMSEWGERPDAHTLLAALRGGQKGGE